MIGRQTNSDGVIVIHDTCTCDLVIDAIAICYAYMYSLLVVRRRFV